jgi:DNA invertase Pin-like site-specific DNA recombinase
MSKDSQKIALYARVSTLLGQDPENQLVHLRAMAAGRGFEIHKEYADMGISGSKERRPALDEMLKDARRGAFQLVGIAALDRLGRSSKNMVLLLEEFQHLNISLISQRESLDFSSPMGKLMFTIMSSLAEMEKSILRDRIAQGLAAKKILAQKTGNGWRCGRKPVVTPAIVSEVQRLRAQGVSIRETARRVKLAKSTVQRILTSAVPTTSPESASTSAGNRGGQNE